MKTLLKVILVYALIIMAAELCVRALFPEYRSLNHNIGVTGGIPFKLNSYGLRDNEFEPDKKGRFRILCVGDSITFGTQNRLEEIYPKVIERLLNEKKPGGYQVINAGGVGGCPPLEYEYLKDKALPELKPDYVIVGLCLNDIGNSYTVKHREEPNAERTPDFWKNKDDFRIYKEALGWNKDLPLGANIKTQINRLRWYLRSKSYLFAFIDVNMMKFMYRIGLKKYSYDMYGEKEQLLAFGIDKTSEEGWEATFSSLIKIRDLLAERGIGFMVVVFPYEFQLSDDNKDNFFNIDKSAFTIDPQARIVKFGKENNIEVLDLLPYFKKIKKRIYFPLDYLHPNAYGHEVAAEEIFEILKKREGIG